MIDYNQMNNNFSQTILDRGLLRDLLDELEL